MQSFVSKADTREMRDYQVLASKYPPLTKEDLIDVSRRFVEGRRASITLMEGQSLDDILGGDWSDDGPRSDKDSVIEEFRIRMDEEYAEGGMPKDVHDIVEKDIIEMEDSYDLFMETRHLDRATIRHLSVQADDGNEALEKIVNHNLQFAMACVGKMMRRNRRAKLIGAKELIAVANVGLVLGARQYDPESNKAFTTYAAYHINGQLYEYLNREDGNIGIKAATLHEQKQIISIRQISESFKSRYGREPNVAEISSLTHISKDRVISRMSMPTIRTQSIFSKGSGEDGEEQEVFLPDLVPNDENSVEAEWANQDKATAMGISMAELAGLPWPQGEIIRLHIGISDGDDEPRPLTVKQIAKELQLTVHSVERELHEGLRSLRTVLDSEGLDDYIIFGGGYESPEGDDGEAGNRHVRPTGDGGSKRQAATTGKRGVELVTDSGVLTTDDPMETIDIDDDLISDIDLDAGQDDLPSGLGGGLTMDEVSGMLDIMSVIDDDGYDMLGYDSEGYNRLGFDRRGIRKGDGLRIDTIIAPYGDGGRYTFIKALFDSGQRTLPGVLEAMRLVGVRHPEVDTDEAGTITITGGGIRVAKARSGIVTFRRYLEEDAAGTD